MILFDPLRCLPAPSSPAPGSSPSAQRQGYGDDEVLCLSEAAVGLIPRLRTAHEGVGASGDGAGGDFGGRCLHVKEFSRN